MQKQILVDGEWVDGDPTSEGQEFRFKIPVGNGFGFQQQNHTLLSAPARRTNVTMAELVFLMGFAPYATLYQAAHVGADDQALYFLESRRYLVGESIDVSDNGMGAELDDFIASGYMTQADKTRITQGVEVQ